MATEDEKQLQMAKIKARNTIRSGARNDAIMGFLEDIQHIPGCAEKLRKSICVTESVLLDDEEAFKFVNSFCL